MFKSINILFKKKLERLRKYLAKNKKNYKIFLIIDRIFDSLCI